ncbi:hypothetical protein Droror1_Dr00024436, partial [Drosera rotundifolia]
MSRWESKLTEEHKTYLNKLFEQSKVEEALHQISGQKAHGPDGLNVRFSKTHWKIVGEEVTLTVLDILNNKGDPTALNEAFLVLTPKHLMEIPTLKGELRGSAAQDFDEEEEEVSEGAREGSRDWGM